MIERGYARPTKQLTIIRNGQYKAVIENGSQRDTGWMIVCVCNRLNEQRVGAAICGGAQCADDVYARCGVRKNCGRCQETIEGMLEDSRRALQQAAE
jgi:bacterioferritin-associated ferredoxin